MKDASSALIVTSRNAIRPASVGQVCNLPCTTHFRRTGRLQTCPTLARPRSRLVSSNIHSPVLHFLLILSALSVSAPPEAIFRADRVELYDLEEDIGEQNDLSQTNPELAERLLTMLKHWQKKVGARFEGGAR